MIGSKCACNLLLYVTYWIMCKIDFGLLHGWEKFRDFGCSSFYIFILKYLFIFYYLLHLFSFVCVCVWGDLRSQKGSCPLDWNYRHPLPDVHVGNDTRVLCKSSNVFYLAISLIPELTFYLKKSLILIGNVLELFWPDVCTTGEFYCSMWALILVQNKTFCIEYCV